MNSSDCYSNNQSDFSSSMEENGISKKRKLSMAGNSLSNIQLKVLQYENQALKHLAQEFENENEFNGLKARITELQETVAKLQKENSDMQKKNDTEKNQLQIQNDSLNSLISDLNSKIKILENENKELELKIIKNIKCEIKDSVGSEKAILEATIDKLCSEINDLKNKLVDREKAVHNSAVNNESDIVVEKICNKLQQFLTSSNSKDDCFKKSKKMNTSKSGTSSISISKSTKLQEEAPKLTAEEQITADNYLNGHFQKGARIYAIWGKDYYSAICGGYDGLSRYKVFYTDDQSTRIIPSDSIIPICMIKEGSHVTVLGETVDDGERKIYDGKILTIPSIKNTEEWHRGLYKIEIKNDDNVQPRDVEWFDICFTESQYKQIIKGFKKKNDVFQENFVESGHRTRRYNAAASSSSSKSG